METAKVDIRKLQFLNDRINQTIDALNQVRLSVHGLSHSAGIPQQFQPPGFGVMGQNQGLGQGGYPQSGYPQQTQGFPPAFVPGLSHSPMPFGVAPFQQATSPFQLGFGQPQQVGLGQIPSWGVGGLSHTGLEGIEAFNRPAWSDPLFAARLQQTFPYAQYAVPPVVTLY